MSIARPAGGAGPAIEKLVRDAAATHAGSGLHIYRASYIDLVLAADSERGTIALVAGSHTQGFPYAGTRPWDNCLLLIGEDGYTFTGRTQGASLQLDFDVELPAARGTIRFNGEMRRARDGQAVQVELDIAIALSRLPARLLGETYNFVELDDMVGMRYTPFELSGEAGKLRVAGAEVAVAKIRGACEQGELTNLKAHDFAIRYEYVGVACPGDDGYGLVQFTSHTLFDGGVLRSALDGYLRRSASAVMTIERGKLTDGNPRGVYSPPQDDPAVVVFETEVDLGLAVLQRQMIRTRDKAGRALHGLREIFTAKPEPDMPRTYHFHPAQIYFLLGFLVVLDAVLSTTAIVFPDTWTQLMHGLPYDDPAGLLRRTGAVWVAFTLVQAVALVRWRDRPYWLTIVAGVRLTELFSDWATIFAAQKVTLLAKVGLAISPPSNLIYAAILVSTYKRLRAGPPPAGGLFTKPWS